jgi:threonine dehydratase
MAVTYVDAYDKDPLVYAGQGTIGLELLKQNPDLDTILVPIGGGGLITGISAAVKGINPTIQVIGVQTEACPAMKASIEEDVFYDKYPTKGSICEALVGGIGALAYELHREAIDDIIIVSEKAIRQAVNHMIYEEKIIAEASSCVGIAALFQEADKIKGKNIAVVISGGNISKDLLKELL